MINDNFNIGVETWSFWKKNNDVSESYEFYYYYFFNNDSKYVKIKFQK